MYSALAKREGLLSKISKHLSKEVVHIVVGDGLPKFVCVDCERVINSFTEFCDMVQDVQKRLHEEKFGFSQDVLPESKSELAVVGTAFDRSKALVDCGQVTVNIGPDGKVECMLCRTYLEMVDHTTLHMVTHGIGTVICRCRVCGQRGELAQFVQTNSMGEVANTVWCSGCHSTSTSKPKNSANDAYRSLSGHTANVCEVCSKSFRSHGHLVRHRLVHSGAKPFLCEVCGSGFSQRSSLKLHVLSHAGLNPHKCPHCGQTFRFRVSLRSHILSLHGSPSSCSSPTKSGDYRCDRCGKQFATVYKLSRHYRSHTGERPYECTRCGKLFSQTGNLNLHRKKHEEEDAVAGCLPTSPSFDRSVITKNQLSDVMMGKQDAESYGVPLLGEQQERAQYIPETGEALVASHDSKFLETILEQDGLGDPGNPLSSIGNVLLNPTDKLPDHTPQFVTMNSEFNSETVEPKSSTELFTHFSPEGLLFIGQSSALEETPSNSEGVALPTFSSLQSGTSVSVPSLPR